VQTSRITTDRPGAAYAAQPGTAGDKNANRTINPTQELLATSIERTVQAALSAVPFVYSNAGGARTIRGQMHS
jgi:hypothetical protein